MQQGWMFLGIGSTMAILQGGWIRHIPPDRTKAISELVRNPNLIEINVMILKGSCQINNLGVWPKRLEIVK